MKKHANALLTSVLCLAVVLPLSLMAVTAIAEIRVKDGYVRATPPGVKSTAAYMKLHNKDDQPQTLIGVSSDWARNTELHNMTSKGGVMMMQRVSSLKIPPRSTRYLQSGGYHLMLINLQRALAPGDEVSVTLEFADDTNLRLKLPVRMYRAEKGIMNRHP